MNILILYANPTGTERLQLEREVGQIKAAVQLVRPPGLQINDTGFVRRGDLQTQLLFYKPDIVQFSGHTSERGELLVESDDGQPCRIPPKTLREVFSHTPMVQCVVLNCCYGKAQATAINQHVPFVIGMQGAVDDAVATAFASRFYQALGSGKSIRQSFSMARTEIALLDARFARLPVLLARKDASPDTAFLVLEPAIAAKFVVDRQGRPRKDRHGLYILVVYIQNAPKGTVTVLYHYLDDYWELGKQVGESREPLRAFADELGENGDIEVRAALWSAEGGTAIRSLLSEALYRHYGKTPATPIQKAIGALVDYTEKGRQV